MAGKWSLLLFVFIASDLASSQISHQSIHDQVSDEGTSANKRTRLMHRILVEYTGAVQGESLLSPSAAALQYSDYTSGQ